MKWHKNPQQGHDKEWKRKIELEQGETCVIAWHPAYDLAPGKERVDEIVCCCIMGGGIATRGDGFGKEAGGRKIAQEKTIDEGKHSEMNS